MPILIDTVRISNFRALRNVQVKLAPLSLLVGMNNSGKTSFLRALQLALGSGKASIFGEDFFDEEQPILVDIKIIPVDDDFNQVPTFDGDWLNVQFGEELVNKDIRNNEFVGFRTIAGFDEEIKEYTVKKYRFTEWQEEKADWEIIEIEDEDNLLTKTFSQIPFHFIDAQRDIIEDLRNRSSYLGKTLSKITFDRQKIQEIQDKIKELNDEIVGSHEVFSTLQTKLNELSATLGSSNQSIEVTPIAKKVRDLNKGVNIQFRDNENSDSFSLSYHGMGTRSWASLLTFDAFISSLSDIANAQEKPFFPILALEEPEAHLHPNAQRQIYAQLTKIKGQKIISTHSPYIVGQAKLEEIRHFYKESNLVVVNQLTNSLAEVEISRKIRREVIHTQGELLFAKMIITHEGESEALALPVFIEAYFGKTPFELGITLVSGNGNNHKPFLILAKDLQIAWALFSDYDKDDVKKGVDNAIIAIGLDKTINYLNVIKLNTSLEKYLIDAGYEYELKQGRIAFVENTTENKHPDNIANITREINAYDIFQLEADLIGKKVINNTTIPPTPVEPKIEKGKTKFPNYYAQKIVETQDVNRRFPPAILQLLKAIAQNLNINPEYATL
jgi:putative ATP-dependent endonuclease of OLD family